MKKLFTFLSTFGLTLALVSCSSDDSGNSVAASPTKSKEMLAYMPKDSAAKTLKKVGSLGDNGLTTVATTYTPNGSDMKIFWKNLDEKFIVLPGNAHGDNGNASIDVSKNDKVITYKAVKLLQEQNNTVAAFDPTTEDYDTYCVENPGNCVALYPVDEAFLDSVSSVMTFVKNKLKHQTYKNHTENMRDSIPKYHYMNSQVQKGDSANQLKVYFQHDVCMLEVKLPHTTGVKVVGYRSNTVYGEDTDYQVEFENAIPASSTDPDNMTIIIVLPKTVQSIDNTKPITFYTKKSLDSDTLLEYTQKLKSGSIPMGQGKYNIIDFSHVTPTEVVKEPETPDEPGVVDLVISQANKNYSVDGAGTYKVKVGCSSHNYFQLYCTASDNNGVTLSVGKQSATGQYNAYLHVDNFECNKAFTFTVTGNITSCGAQF